MTVAIVYNGGAYGTYLEWCLTTLTSDAPIVSPFTDIGNSHKFKGNLLEIGLQGWQSFLDSDNNSKFARFHPTSLDHPDLDGNLDYICSTADHLLYVYPSRDHVLLSVNNYISKTHGSNWWNHRANTDGFLDTIYKSWPVSVGTPPNDIPIWIRREFLSFYLMPTWFDQLKWYHLDYWNNPNACIVTTEDLLHNFETTMNRIQQSAQLEFVRPVSDLLHFHEQNLNLQKNLTQDSLCKDIMQSVIGDSDLEWDMLPFGSEVWLQWELRNQGFEIRCNGLDTFPTNSIQLKELLYSV
jgi:hypothetical protein